jgi:hypothetical protein
LFGNATSVTLAFTPMLTRSGEHRVTDEDVAFAKGDTYKDMGLLAEAISEFEKALSDESLKFKATRRIAACLDAMKLTDDAEKVLLRSLCLSDIAEKDRMWVYADLADLYAKQGKAEAALERLLDVKRHGSVLLADLDRRIEELYEKVDLSAFDKESMGMHDALAAGARGKLPADLEAAPLPTPSQARSDPRRCCPRVKFSGLVQYSFDQSVWTSGYSCDISSSGMFVLTHQPVPLGSVVFLKFDLPDALGTAAVDLIGQVVRQENRRNAKDAVLGMGVHFVAVDKQLRQQLSLLVDTLAAEEVQAQKKAAVIRLHCDACSRILAFPESAAGSQVQCTCGAKILVPVTVHSPTSGNPLRGFHLAGCRIDRAIGRGSVATVYKGHHLTLDIPVAIKILNPAERKQGSQLGERFLKEARVIARIHHANIVSVMNAGEEHGQRFIVMQYVPGRPLSEALVKPGKLTGNDFVRIFLEVSGALQAAHEHSVVHGDVKPANILLMGAGDRAMLVDFGLVKDLTTYEESDTHGLALGTPLYMSPEQARGEHAVDFRSDIYSLAATMYHVLAGKPPFGGMTAMEVIRKHMEAPFPVPTALAFDVPGRVWEIIAKGMEKKPENRYQSAEHLKQDLLQVSRDVALEEFKPLYAGMRKKKGELKR